MTFDPRLTPARPDLAADHLRDRVQADRYVSGKVFAVTAPQAPLRRAPSPDAPLETEALKGDRVTVYDTTDEGWAWGQLASDGYVGWLPTAALGDARIDVTHKVTALRTIAFPGPSIKLPPVEMLSLGCRLAVTMFAGSFAVTDEGHYLPSRHLASLDRFETDPVAVAERFLGIPYLWGGKTSLGLDCSGLVQVAFTACGIPCPRDSDMQQTMLGDGVDFPGHGLARGDLLFWPGHVALACDADTIIHANAFHMAVAIEPVAEALPRIKAAGSDLTCVKRLNRAV